MITFHTGRFLSITCICGKSNCWYASLSAIVTVWTVVPADAFVILLSVIVKVSLPSYRSSPIIRGTNVADASPADIVPAPSASVKSFPPPIAVTPATA